MYNICNVRSSNPDLYNKCLKMDKQTSEKDEINDVYNRCVIWIRYIDYLINLNKTIFVFIWYK